MINETIENISRRGGNSELSPEMQKQVAKVQYEFAKQNKGFELDVKPKLWHLENNQKAYSCTIIAEDRQTHPGCDTSFLVPADIFSMEEISRQFQKLQGGVWDTSSTSEEEAVEMIKQRYTNKGEEMPGELEELLREAV